ncbi:MAG: AAA family ATPase, partial [Saprospiraceae bacterium]|nr:AAA family ATPase [Saprospiraceae bacterium]
MSRLIQNLHIQNFKSIRDLTLDCDRINIFIGKPNAGKSNILEAISLLGAGYSQGRFMEGFIRYNSMVHLFRNFNVELPVEIESDNVFAQLRKTNWGAIDFKFSLSPRPLQDAEIGRFFRASAIDIGLSATGSYLERSSNDENPNPGPIKKYDFQPIKDYQERGLFLYPPHGDNFYLIARSNPELRAEIQRFLKPNGLEFLFNLENDSMAVVQRTDESLYSFPLHLVPDTFQRYIFHLAAILSNQDSVLLFEEPESHSY